MPTPTATATPSPTTRAIRCAVTSGGLTAKRLGEREAYAQRHGAYLLDVLSEADRIHLLVFKALGPTATIADACATIYRYAPQPS